MFGRKGLKKNPEAQQHSSQSAVPSPPQDMNEAEMEQRTDDAIAMLSEAIGLDLDFDIASIFSPRLWDDPQIGPMLSKAGLEANMRGNKISLLKNPQTLAALSTRPKEDPVRESLVNSGFGMVPFNPNAANGFADGLEEMQRKQLKEWASRTDITEEACKYAVWNLHQFSSEVMKGNVELG